MDSNIHRTSGESAGIVATALRVEAEGRGRVPPADLFFHTFFAPRPEYFPKHQKCYAFITIIFYYFFIMLHQSEAAIS